MNLELIDRIEPGARAEAGFTHWPCAPEGAAIGPGAAAGAAECLARARELDLHGADAIARLRAWSDAGDAMLALGTSGELAGLQQAAAAYSMAEALLDEAAATVLERVHVHHAHGRTLLRLADGSDVELAAAAASRLASALSLARRHAPERVAGIKLELCRAEHVIAVRQMQSAAHPVHAAFDA